MKKQIFYTLFALLSADQTAFSQIRREEIYTDYVFYDKRLRLQKDLNENTIARTFSGTVSPENEHKFESACLAISQFLFRNETVSAGIRKMLERYDSLSVDTRRALLEAIHATYPVEFSDDLQRLLPKERDPRLFSMCAAYLYRASRTIVQSNTIKLQMIETFPSYDTIAILLALEEFLNDKYQPHQSLPPLKDMFAHHKKMGNKVIYSFQRWNRDFPGMAVVQNADGSFARHPDGRIMVFEQLARSASDLPFFLTNGNTPQGIYSIQGTAVSRNKFIGPTPNIQMLMPHEDTTLPFQHKKNPVNQDIVSSYRELLPESWKNYPPMMESFTAGKIGRTAIIAHGTTIDPDYFKDKPFYPLTPTMGCLCAKELWNVTSGKLLVSEQFNLYSAFLSTPGNKGYLIVINVDDKPEAVTRAEVERITGK